MSEKPNPLVLKDGKVIQSAEELILHARENSNTVEAESETIDLWLEALGYHNGARLRIETKAHLSGIGVEPEYIEAVASMADLNPLLIADVSYMRAKCHHP